MQALAKVGNPNILVNIVSRRVRQMNAGGSGMGRPLVLDTVGLGAADIALREIVEGAISFEQLVELDGAPVAPKKRRSKKG